MTTVTIFEGPDGAGKSTLMRQWAEMHDVVQLRENGPYLGKSGNWLVERYTRDILAAREGRVPVLIDRSWISEGIYGPVMRKISRLTEADVTALEQVAVANRTVVVLCLPPYERCKAAYLHRKEIEYLEDESQLRTVYDGYQDYRMKQLFPEQRSLVPHVIYDYTQAGGSAAFRDFVDGLRS